MMETKILKNPKIINALDSALKQSYCKYSNFQVACLFEYSDSNLEYVTGFNIENAAFSCTICAERSAICSAFTRGKKYITANKTVWIKTKQNYFVTPCGVCLQVLFEFFDPNTPVYCVNNKNHYQQRLLKEFLPFNFNFEQ